MKNPLDAKALFIENLSVLLETEEISERTFKLCCKNCGFDEMYYIILFPKGAREVIYTLERFYDNATLRLLETMEKPVGTNAKIILALKTRLTVPNKIVLNAIKDFYSKNMKRFLRVKSIYETCDFIWRYAGDTSLDYNFYTKRSILAYVYLRAMDLYLSDYDMNTESLALTIESLIKKVSGRIKALKNMVKIENIRIVRMFL